MSLIAVDMTPALPGGKNGGAKILAVELLKSFCRMAPQYKFLLLTASWNHEDLAFLDGPKMSRLSVLRGPEPIPKPAGTQYPGKWRQGLGKMGRYVRGGFKTGLWPRKLLRSRNVDLLFCPFTAPTYAEPGVPMVSIILDLQHHDLPQFFTSYEIGLRNAQLREAGQKAAHIICISEQVRQAVLKILKTDPEKTHTQHICIQLRLSRPDTNRIDEVLAHLGIDRRSYMFYPANFWLHKNHRMLFTAYGMFLERNPNQKVDLVLTGASNDAESRLKQAVADMGLTQRIHFLGFLPEEKLAAVWHGCEFLVFPSLYEGFGIPVLEAMSIGKPVLCSNTGSMQEIAGDAALFFDPQRPREMVDCLDRIVRDSSLRSDLAGRGIHRAERFQPSAMTRGYLQIFEAALSSPVPTCNRLNRRRT